MKHWFALFFLIAAACSGDTSENNGTSNNGTSNNGQADAGNNGQSDAETDQDRPDVDDTGTIEPDAPTEDATTDVADGGQTLITFPEVEPNDGTTLDEINRVEIGTRITGTFPVGDQGDIFQFDTEPGRAYQITLDPLASGFPLHATLFDDGRGEDAPSEDYIQIGRETQTINFVAMGQGGYFLAVRDARLVDGGGNSGDPAFEYALELTEIPLSDIIVGALDYDNANTGTLSGPATMHAYTFNETEGTDFIADLSRVGDGNFRLFVFANDTGSWIARNQNRSAGDNTPLIDAPLFASGDMLLLVGNINEEAQNLGYSIDASKN